MYGYEWTEEYGIFRLTIDAKIQKEIRPVFHEELDFFGMDAYAFCPKILMRQFFGQKAYATIF